MFFIKKMKRGVFGAALVALLVGCGGGAGTDTEGSNAQTNGGATAQTGNSGDSSDTSDNATTPTPPEETPVSLKLSIEKHKIILKRDPGSLRYEGVSVPVTVTARFKDGHEERIADRVQWDINASEDRIFYDTFDWLTIYKAGTYAVSVRYKGLESNKEIVSVKQDDDALLYSEVNYPDAYFRNDYGYDALLNISLRKRPTHEVILPLRIDPQTPLRFIDEHYNKVTKLSLHFKPDMWDTPYAMVAEVPLKILDKNTTQTLTIVTEAMQSDDQRFDAVDTEDIAVASKPPIVVTPPESEQLRGAIRGVRINFVIRTAQNGWTKVELIDPPKGMRIVKPYMVENSDDAGVIVAWDVPMDAKEGKVYTVTAKASDPTGRSKTITFPIKVPKTTPIKTELKHNELIVTDKDSPLYGMKLKGHNAEDISKVRLRSVRYEDVWKKRVKRESAQDKVEHIVFVIDNMPEALDVKMPKWMDTYEERIKLGMHSYKYNGPNLLSGDVYTRATRQSYLYENTNGYVYFHENNTSELFMVVLEKAQKRGK